MKFLLKQRIIFKQEGTVFRVYPNEFSKDIVKEANKRELILDANKTWTGKYYRINYYEILENDFKRLYYWYKEKIELKRRKFFSRPLLDQLIFLLKYIFERNNRAKEVEMRWARYNAYDDKQEFLMMALDIAGKIRNEKFSYGYQVDPEEIKHNIIYYFQLGAEQVSFHSSILYEAVPEFQGRWNVVIIIKSLYQCRSVWMRPS